MPLKAIIAILADADGLAREAAQRFVDISARAVAECGESTVGLSGGSTPKKLFELLANPAEPFRAMVPWNRIHFFWTDERTVPPDDPQSNYRMANDAMLSRVPVAEHNIHRIAGENPNPAETAEDYEQTLREVFKLSEREVPRLDLMLLGLGHDGHTASIFPGSEVLHEERRLVRAPWVEDLKSYRITMTLPVINNSAVVFFLVSGNEKAGILREVLEGPASPERLPAQAVDPLNGSLMWLVDRDAAMLLSPET